MMKMIAQRRLSRHLTATYMKKIFVNEISVQSFNCNTSNQYTALAGFADNDDNDNTIWDHRCVTIPKPFLLKNTKTEAWKKLATQNNLLDDKHNKLMADTSGLTRAAHHTIFDSVST